MILVFIIIVALLCVLPSLFVGWIAMLVLGAFGVQAGYWPCVGAVFVLSFIIGCARTTVTAER